MIDFRTIGKRPLSDWRPELTHDRRETMKRSTERILTTHVGSLVRPPGLIDSCGRRKRPGL